MAPFFQRGKPGPPGGLMILGARHPIRQAAGRLSRPPNIDDWLDVATWVLAGPARERICLEIKAHYSEAVDARVARGIDESEARKAALTELGDAATAATDFRKRHLTEMEANLIRATLKWSSHLGLLIFEYVLACVFFWFLFSGILVAHVPVFRPVYLSCVSLVLLLRTISFLVTRSGGKRFNIRLLVSIESVHLLFIDGLWIYFFYGDMGVNPWLIGVMVLWLVRVGQFRLVRIWLKLGSVADVQQELPPRDVASS